MRSLVKLYDMYKAGEYIKEFSNEKMQYLKILDEVPDDIRSKLIRLDDKISQREDIKLSIMLLVMLSLGVALGYVMGFSFGELKEVVQTLAQNTTVIP